MPQSLLDGVHVVDLGVTPAARAGRILGDLGASVVRVVPPAGDALDRQRRRRVERGQAGARPREPTIPRSTRCSPRPTS